jgi:hypothetical protein
MTTKPWTHQCKPQPKPLARLAGGSAFVFFYSIAVPTATVATGILLGIGETQPKREWEWKIATEYWNSLEMSPLQQMTYWYKWLVQ